MMYLGLDVHKQSCHGTVMDVEGEIVKQGRFSYDPRGLKEFTGWAGWRVRMVL